MICKGAEFSEDQVYRYALWRIWDRNTRPALFIGLNPSAADEEKDDPTIRRCMGFAKKWKCGGLLMANIYAYRSTDPKLLNEIKDPIGPYNIKYIKNLASQTGLIIAAWGNLGSNILDVTRSLRKYSYVKCLRVNKSGAPAHPLYIPYKINLKPFPI